MAKFTFTEFSSITGAHDTESPFEESDLDVIKQNHKVLLSSPFTFIWYEEDATGGNRDQFSASTGSFAQRPGGGWNCWVHPGAERLVVSVLVKVGTSTQGDARMRMQIEGPGFPADSFSDAFISNFTNTTFAQGVFTFSKGALEPRWGRLCSLKVAVKRDSGAGAVTIAEDPNPRSFWEQAI